MKYSHPTGLGTLGGMVMVMVIMMVTVIFTNVVDIVIYLYLHLFFLHRKEANQSNQKIMDAEKIAKKIR